MRVAAVQTVPIDGDVDANLAQHRELVCGTDADLLVFPELSLTGYLLDPELAFDADDARIDPLDALARERGITLVVGAPIRLQALHIGAFVLTPEGRRIYTKRRLGAFSASAAVDGRVPPAEATVFAPGALDPLVDRGPHRAAIAICADIGDPAHPRAARDRGASIYLASMFVIPSEIEAERAKLAHYARSHRMTVVQANFGGPTGGLASGGRSTLWGPDGRVVGELPPAGHGVISARLDA